MADRLAYLLEQRGFDVRTIRAVMHAGIEQVCALEARRKLEALAQMTGSDALIGVATLFKRVKNITKGISASGVDLASLGPTLTEPAEKVLWQALTAKGPGIRGAIARGAYKEAFSEIAGLQPVVARFFDDVLVMADDADLRAARLALVAALRDLILELADISEMAPE